MNIHVQTHKLEKKRSTNIIFPFTVSKQSICRADRQADSVFRSDNKLNFTRYTPEKKLARFIQITKLNMNFRADSPFKGQLSTCKQTFKRHVTRFKGLPNKK